ncbi:MAG: hypothetical protein GX326_05100 [Clostridiaceae bacterium]|nr:hypothetical protein [Clostridiaceae bacterium]
MSKVKRIIFAFICAYLMTGLVAGMLGVLFQYGFALHGLGFDLVSGLSFFFLWLIALASICFICF